MLYECSMTFMGFYGFVLRIVISGDHYVTQKE